MKKSDKKISILAKINKKTEKELLSIFIEKEELKIISRFHFAENVRDFNKKFKTHFGEFITKEELIYFTSRWKKLYLELIENIDRKTKLKIIKRDGEKCQYCLGKKDDLEIHHVIPQTKNGSNSINNLVLACRKCNQQIYNDIEIPNNWFKIHPESDNCP